MGQDIELGKVEQKKMSEWCRKVNPDSYEGKHHFNRCILKLRKLVCNGHRKIGLNVNIKVAVTDTLEMRSDNYLKSKEMYYA